jgi:hypothetical protein
LKTIEFSDEEIENLKLILTAYSASLAPAWAPQAKEWTEKTNDLIKKLPR